MLVMGLLPLNLQDREPLKYFVNVYVLQPRMK